MTNPSLSCWEQEFAALLFVRRAVAELSYDEFLTENSRKDHGFAAEHLPDPWGKSWEVDKHSDEGQVKWEEK